MTKLLGYGFWNGVARLILRNRLFILFLVAAFTVFLGTQWKYMRFTYTEANLLPDDHEVNLEYNKFLDQFGEEGNLIVFGIKDSTLFTPETLNKWNALSDTINDFNEVALSVSLKDLKLLQKQEELLQDKQKKGEILILHITD